MLHLQFIYQLFSRQVVMASWNQPIEILREWTESHAKSGFIKVYNRILQYISTKVT